MFVDYTVIFIFNFAIPALHMDAGIAEILFGDNDSELFSQILELVIQFFRFQWRHLITAPVCASD